MATHGRDSVRRAWGIGVLRNAEQHDEDHKQQCRKLMDTLRRHCPDHVPPPPLPPGEPGKPVVVQGEVLQRLVLVAALGQVGIDGPDGEASAPGVLWVDGDSELYVLVSKVQVAISTGAIALAIPVACEETGHTEVHVTFAVGRPERPLGMVAATEERPRGPREVVDVWGEALIAFAWRIVLDVAAGTAAHAGEDTDGAFLLPAALTSTGAALTVLPQARHSFDRVSR